MTALEPLTAFLHGYQPRAGETVVEVGAGTAEETRYLALLVGKKGLVLAIEPHPDQAALLRQRTRELVQVQVLQIAALSYRGRATLTNETYARSHITNGDGFDVACATLDELTLGLPRIDLLKMNIEGSEVSALLGFREGLRRTQHAVVSCHDFLGMATREHVEGLLAAAGFELLEPLPVSRDEEAWAADYVYGARR